ncbi:terpenoid synthase [Penicillium crustosum]|nr:terpenoid synthase [Penicillium crustosum]KAJ5395611.1 terpenoid synthase [Penicillium crustosum]
MLFLAPGYIFPNVATPVTVAIDFAQAVKQGAYNVLDLKASPIPNPELFQPPSRVSVGTAVGREERNEEIIRGPLNYLLSLPGKDIRGKLIDALNEWFRVPEDKLNIIKEIVVILHTASLLIDDIQDSSELRRGNPVAHRIFGVAQTINSANYAYFLAQAKLADLNDSRAFDIFTKGLLKLHRGQGMELYWRDNLICPTEEEYVEMVSCKTGGLFYLAVQLMQLNSEVTVNFSNFINLLGIIFQIRDDYMNLQSGTMTKTKGFSEDLTEGKFGYPIIHSIHAAPNDSQLIQILKLKTKDEVIKQYAVRYIESTGSFVYCREKLDMYLEEANETFRGLEMLLGPSKGIRAILDFLRTR